MELYVVGGIFLVCAAIAGIWFYNDAVNDQEAHDRARRYREGIEAEERRKARLAAEEAARRAAEEAAKQAAIMRQKELERIRLKSEAAAACITRTVQHLDDLCNYSEQILVTVRETEELFKLRRFHPFWDAAVNTYGVVTKIENLFYTIATEKAKYSRLASEIPHELAPFVDTDGVDEAQVIITMVQTRLTAVTDEAHSIEPFSLAYGNIRLEDAINRGFSNLQRSLTEINSSIRQSAAVLSSKLQNISGQLYRIGSKIDDSSQALDKRHAELAQTIQAGISSTTALMTDHHLAAQRSATQAVDELRMLSWKANKLYYDDWR